jgi:hypothetical protein
MSIREWIDETFDLVVLADGFEEALIGVATCAGQPELAVYDAGKCIQNERRFIDDKVLLPSAIRRCLGTVRACRILAEASRSGFTNASCRSLAHAPRSTCLPWLKKAAV